RILPLITRLATALINREEEPVSGERLRRRCSSVDFRVFLHHLQRDDAAGLAEAAAAHPSAFARHGPGLLLIAAVRGKAAAAEELLRQGVDVNAPAMLPGSEAG